HRRFGDASYREHLFGRERSEPRGPDLGRGGETGPRNERNGDDNRGGESSHETGSLVDGFSAEYHDPRNDDRAAARVWRRRRGVAANRSEPPCSVATTSSSSAAASWASRSRRSFAIWAQARWRCSSGASWARARAASRAPSFASTIRTFKPSA